MKHIYVNFKRFDVPLMMGGVNRKPSIRDFSKWILRETLPNLETYKGVDFAHYYPEAHLSDAVETVGISSAVKIGSQGVFRRDVEKGGNFGAFTTSLPAAAVKALGCQTTIIGHCEERLDKNNLFDMAASCRSQSLVNEVLNQEVLCAQKQQLEVLYCIGEQESELEDWEQVLGEQLEIGLGNCNLDSVIIAYEPVWSIGPGKQPAERPYIKKIARFVKSQLGKKVPIIYGGGLRKENVGMLSSIDEIDGGLIALTRFTEDIGFYCDEYLEIIDMYLKG